MQVFDVGEHVLNGHKFFVGKGFGYKRIDDEVHQDKGIPCYLIHNFKVKIAETVFIGNGTNIDIGRDRDTEIRDYTVVDSLVHVGHSAIIGKKCIIVSGTVIGGHAEIGDGSHIGMNCSIKQGVKIGKGCFIGAHTFVTHDIPDHTLYYDFQIKPIAKPISESNEYVQRSVSH